MRMIHPKADRLRLEPLSYEGVLPAPFGPAMIKRSMRLPILPNLSTFVMLHCGHVNTWRRVFPVGKPIPARTAKFPD